MFFPYYGQSIANYISTVVEREKYSEFEIIELGSGNGRLKDSIQLPFKKYSTIDATSDHCDVRKSAFDCNFEAELPCFVICAELIDNLSHDLIKIEKGRVYQCEITSDNENIIHQEFLPLNDSLIERYLGAEEWPLYGQISKLSKWNRLKFKFFPVFIPTNTFRLLEKLSEIPKAHLIIADFDCIDSAIMNCCNPPRVHSFMGNRTEECPSHLVHPGPYDIFFAHDFHQHFALSL